MLERFCINVGGGTIVAVIAKLAFIYEGYHPAGFHWPMAPHLVCALLIGIFMILLRGKMIHDDAAFFSEISTDAAKFNQGRRYRILATITIGLTYLSWLLWAPAILFLDDCATSAAFLSVSLGLSTVCLFLDSKLRKTSDPKRALWVLINLLYMGVLTMLAFDLVAASVAGSVLICLILLDWIATDPLNGHLAKEALPGGAAETLEKGGVSS